MSEFEFVITLKVKGATEDDGYNHPVDWSWDYIFNKTCGGNYTIEVLNCSPVRTETPEIFDGDLNKRLEEWSMRDG